MNYLTDSTNCQAFLWFRYFSTSEEQIKWVYDDNKNDNFLQFSLKSYIVGIHYNCLAEVILLNTVNHLIFMCSLFCDFLIVVLFAEIEIRNAWHFSM